MENALAGVLVFDDLDIAFFKPRGLVWAQPGVAHEQHIVMEGLANLLPSRLGRILRAIARGLVEDLVFGRREPRAMLYLAR